jgi:hypothetical protein
MNRFFFGVMGSFALVMLFGCGKPLSVPPPAPRWYVEEQERRELDKKRQLELRRQQEIARLNEVMDKARASMNRATSEFNSEADAAMRTAREYSGR